MLIITSEDAVNKNSQLADRITKKGVKILAVPVKRGRCDLNVLLNELSKRGIGHLLVEGGPTVITSFLKENLADEVYVYIASKALGSQGSVDITKPMAELTNFIGLNQVKTKHFDGDTRISGLCS